jgi:hypothetical protein
VTKFVTLLLTVGNKEKLRYEESKNFGEFKPPYLITWRTTRRKGGGGSRFQYSSCSERTETDVHPVPR